ncbi:MAG: hypothetical protein Q8N51_09660 [Gammaproteobacteria bacterium]|nr:hypothetical protein [Gammaproteobacteria bacterium]
MFRAKLKRGRESNCNICGNYAQMSWDHVPPKGGITPEPLEIKSIINSLTGTPEKGNVRDTQNGLKFRTICDDCNNLIGREYDPEINKVAFTVRRFLNSKLILPQKVTLIVKPQRLMRSIVGHLIAASVSGSDANLGKEFKRFVLCRDSELPSSADIFFWIHPYALTVVSREIVQVSIRAPQEMHIMHLLKYFPVAYVCSDTEFSKTIPSLGQFRKLNFDAEVELEFDTKTIKYERWPETPSDQDGTAILLGANGAQGIAATRKGRA